MFVGTPPFRYAFIVSILSTFSSFFSTMEKMARTAHRARCSSSTFVRILVHFNFQSIYRRAETEYLTFLRIKEGQFLSPPNASPAALDLLNKLFVADPSKRLGAASLEEIQSHPFFQGVEWSRVRHGPAPDPVPLSRRPVDALWKMKMGIGGGSGRYGGQPAANVTYVVNDGQAAGELESGAAGERPVAVEGSPSPPQGRAPVALALQIQAALEGLRLGVQAAPDHEGPESEGPSLAPEARAPALA